MRNEERELTRTSGGPEKISGFTVLGRVDVDDVEGVTVAEKIVNSPFESHLASLREVHGHPNFPIAGHLLTRLLSVSNWGP